MSPYTLAAAFLLVMSSAVAVETGCLESISQHQAAPDIKVFAIKKIYAEGRLSVRLVGADSGIAAYWRLPKELTGPISAKIGDEGEPATILLYAGDDLEKYFAPSGSPRPFRPSEKATAGRLECTPTGPHKVKLTFYDLEFNSVTIRQVGPIEVGLDIPPAP